MKCFKKNNSKMIMTVLSVLSAVIGMFFVSCQTVYALGLAESAQKVISDELFWVGLIIAIVIILGMLVKKNFTGMVVTIVVAAIVLVIIKRPTIISDIGEKIASLIGL